MSDDAPIPKEEARGTSRHGPRQPRFLARQRPTIADLGLVIVYVALHCGVVRQLAERLELTTTRGGLYLQAIFGLITFIMTGFIPAAFHILSLVAEVGADRHILYLKGARIALLLGLAALISLLAVMPA